MTSIDAYALACARWGADACVWSPSDDRHVVGRWVVLGELDPAACVILRTTRRGVEVHGEGRTLIEACTKAGLS